MGIQERDYYRDKLREIQQYEERAVFRRPLGRPRPWGKGAPTKPAPSAALAIAVVIAAVVVVLLLVRVWLRH